MAPPDDEHDCGWKAYAKAQEDQLAEQGKKLDEMTRKLLDLERRFLARKSERRKSSKLPPPLPPKAAAKREAGDNFAVLHTLVASCERNGINPIAYLMDVLGRVQSHPARKIADLLPHRCKPPDSPAAAG